MCGRVKRSNSAKDFNDVSKNVHVALNTKIEFKVQIRGLYYHYFCHIKIVVVALAFTHLWFS